MEASADLNGAIYFVTRWIGQGDRMLDIKVTARDLKLARELADTATQSLVPQVFGQVVERRPPDCAAIEAFEAIARTREPRERGASLARQINVPPSRVSLSPRFERPRGASRSTGRTRGRFLFRRAPLDRPGRVAY